MVRSNVLRLAYLPLWGSLQPGRLALELRPFPQLKRHWQHLKAGLEKGEKSGMERYEYEFLPSLVRMFLTSVEGFGKRFGKKEGTPYDAIKSHKLLTPNPKPVFGVRFDIHLFREENVKPASVKKERCVRKTCCFCIHPKSPSQLLFFFFLKRKLLPSVFLWHYCTAASTL